MFDMGHIDSETPSDVMRWLQSEAAVLWPAFLGSLSLRRSRWPNDEADGPPTLVAPVGLVSVPRFYWAGVDGMRQENSGAK
jgi:hypothetical protein